MSRVFWVGNLGICILLLFCLVGCTDIFEKDISNDTVTLNAPFDGLVTPNRGHQFWWNGIEGATNYNLQIVAPSFDRPEKLIANINLVDNVYDTILAPGIYQWSVVGFNFGYDSNFEVFNLTITQDSLQDLSNQAITLQSPKNQAHLNTQEIEFLWQPVESAKSYTIQIAQPDFSNDLFIISSNPTQLPSFSTVLEEGSYEWRVRGLNETSVTLFSKRSLVLDLTAPQQPILTTPGDGAVLASPVLLKWTRGEGVVSDSVFVYSDEQLQNLLIKTEVQVSNYILMEETKATYYWQVKSKDMAGNESPFSAVRKFTIE